MNCPRCSNPLSKQNLRGINETVETYVCNNCGGQWFENDALSKVDEIIEPTILEIRRIPGKREQLETLMCPSCANGQFLGKKKNPRDTFVIMDYCPACKGIWLDQGELEAIQKENMSVTLTRMYRWLMNGEE